MLADIVCEIIEASEESSNALFPEHHGRINLSSHRISRSKDQEIALNKSWL
jgi:hypothetical protein